MAKKDGFAVIREAHTFILLHRQFYAWALLFTLLIASYSLKTVLPTQWQHISSWVLSFGLFGLTVYLYTLPFFLYKATKKESITKMVVKKEVIFSIKRIFFPSILVFFFSFLPFVVVTFIDALNHTSLYPLFFPDTSNNHLFGFYPYHALVTTVIEIVTMIFLFSPVLFSLKRQSYFRSFVSSVPYFMRHFRFVLPLIILDMVYVFLTLLFFPEGNYIASFLEAFVDTYLLLLISASVFFYYKKNYPIEESLFVDTPKQSTQHAVVYRRIIAAGIDLFIVTTAYSISALLFGVHIIQLDPQSPYESWSLIGPSFYLFLCGVLCYFVLLEWKTQATLGKKIMGIKVLSDTGGTISLKQAFIRNVFRVIDLFPYMVPYLLGLIILAANEKKQRLGDQIAHTIVVK